MDFSDFDSVEEIVAFIHTFATTFSRVARKILFWSAVCFSLTSISIYVGFNSPSMWPKLIAGPALIPCIACALFCLVFYLAAKLPELISENLDFITKAFEDDIPDVLELFQDKKMQGTRKVLMTGGIAIKVLNEAIGDLADSGRIISSTAFLANPFFWLLYLLTILASLGLSFVIWLPKMISLIF